MLAALAAQPLQVAQVRLPGLKPPQEVALLLLLVAGVQLVQPLEVEAKLVWPLVVEQKRVPRPELEA